MNAAPHDLNRFVQAQQSDFAPALAEIQAGRKRSHWMLVRLPADRRAGFQFHGQRIRHQERRRSACLPAHPVLGPRLLACTEAALGVEGRSAYEIFGSPDDLKLRSSATLFAHVSAPGSVFHRLLERYYPEGPDGATLQLLSVAGGR